ncbi:hypothetical protein NN561_008454 [Cricetulus griseus]
MLPPPACGSGHCACAQRPGGGAEPSLHPLFLPALLLRIPHPSSLPHAPGSDRQVSRCAGRSPEGKDTACASAWRPPLPRCAASHVRGVAGHLLPRATLTLLASHGPATPPRCWGPQTGAMSRGFFLRH